MKPTEEISAYIEAHAAEAYELLLELARIPAPSGNEEKRAEFCLAWLKACGAKDAFIDEVKNVILPIGCDGDGPITVYMAHSDVVFPDTETLPLKIEDGKIYCPGIGDDTANAVALMYVMKYLTEHPETPSEGVLLVINSCEEGLGNLRGSRAIMEKYAGRVREFITFDGYAKGICNKAVGSRRYSVELLTEGGHSWSAFGNRNAIVLMAQLIGRLTEVTLPAEDKTTYNIGTISGGTSVNTIAQSASITYEFRSDNADNLRTMQSYFDSVLDEFRARDIDVRVELIGERPCGENVDKDAMDRLFERASTAIENNFGLVPIARSGSTDCNIPLSLGVPAVCLACVQGGGAHTREEYVEIDSLKPGLYVAFEMILNHFE